MEKTVTERDQALEAINSYFDDGQFEAELSRRIAYKTESNLAGCEIGRAHV